MQHVDGLICREIDQVTGQDKFHRHDPVSTGPNQLAHDIGRNHLDNVVRVFTDTGTVWVNYAPESAAPGNPAKPDFTGWSGIGPIVLADAPAKRLAWDLRLTDEHGVAALPIGTAAKVELHVAARSSPARNRASRPRSRRR